MTALSRADVLVIGAGIAGLTAAALLARHGKKVCLLEAHQQSGGCAGTFCRGPYIFDAGATQVAGFELGGSHQRLCSELGVALPTATPLDPGCVVDLNDGHPPVRIWRDQQRWKQERRQQFLVEPLVTYLGEQTAPLIFPGRHMLSGI